MRDSGIQWHRFERPTAHREFAEELWSRLRHTAFSDDGRWLAVSGDKRAAVWDLSKGGPGVLIEDAEAHFLFRSNELFGSRSRTNAENCFRWRVMLATNSAAPPSLTRLPLVPSPDGFTSLAVMPNSVVINGSKGSQVLAPGEFETGKERWVRTATGVSVVSSDGRWIGIHGAFSASLNIYRLPELERVARLTHWANISDFEFSPLGDEVAIGSSRGVEFWNTSARPVRTRRLRHRNDGR